MLNLRPLPAPLGQLTVQVEGYNLRFIQSQEVFYFRFVKKEIHVWIGIFWKGAKVSLCNRGVLDEYNSWAERVEL